MFGSFAKRLFGTKNEREIKRIRLVVGQVNALEAETKSLSDTELLEKTALFRTQVENGRVLDEILPEAFAVVREASSRVLGMRHFDEQLIGGIVLHEGRIAEMKTGEGKTLVATLPVYLNALARKGVHVVTVNDYLAKRDSEWMGKIYRFLGLSVGVIVHGLSDEERKAAYRSDVSYGTNNEFGFDYLRDNMKYHVDEYVQRPLNYAIVDEVDSILIDEARTPLIISGPTEESTDKYVRVNALIPALGRDTDYTIDEKARASMLSEEGVAHLERLLNVENLYAPQQMMILHHVNQALKAHAIFKKDVDYVVKDGKVVIVDEFTGRLMPGRRYSDGLHQALEAKENVRIENENQTLATITFQNYFRMYGKLAGMTGTADTEAVEFHKIYNLDVVVIPTHRTMCRSDKADIIYKTENAKFKAVTELIKDLHAKQQPVLVGTVSVEKSERLSLLLKREGLRHHVLNAKYHEKEAEIIAQAGRLGAVTISTNMAGRGTDIILGGNPEFLAKNECKPEMTQVEKQAIVDKYRSLTNDEQKKVIAAGGLFVLGTERHESRRIDNQLRGRSGRQGDPGMSQFTISLEDDLMRIFGSERISGMMDRLGMKEDETIEHPWISKAIENAQRRVEAHNFDIRKNVIEFDDVMNKQRQTVYGKRRAIVDGLLTKDMILDMVDQLAESLGEEFVAERGEEWNRGELADSLSQHFNLKAPIPEDAHTWGDDQLGEWIFTEVEALYAAKEAEIGSTPLRHIERVIMLQTLDQLWKDHLLNMDHIREGIGLRGYAQRDPILEYKREGFQLFQEMMTRFETESLRKLFHVQVKRQEEKVEELEMKPVFQKMTLGRSVAPQKQAPVKHEGPKVGRNDPCPCGSGKKYKKCCGLAIA